MVKKNFEVKQKCQTYPDKKTRWIWMYEWIEISGWYIKYNGKMHLKFKKKNKIQIEFG